MYIVFPSSPLLNRLWKIFAEAVRGLVGVFLFYFVEWSLDGKGVFSRAIFVGAFQGF